MPDAESTEAASNRERAQKIVDDFACGPHLRPVNLYRIWEAALDEAEARGCREGEEAMGELRDIAQALVNARRTLWWGDQHEDYETEQLLRQLDAKIESLGLANPRTQRPQD